MKKAILESILICKDRNVLKEYLENREQEVVDIMMTLFDDEQIFLHLSSTGILYSFFIISNSSSTDKPIDKTALSRRCSSYLSSCSISSSDISQSYEIGIGK